MKKNLKLSKMGGENFVRNANADGREGDRSEWGGRKVLSVQPCSVVVRLRCVW